MTYEKRSQDKSRDLLHAIELGDILATEAFLVSGINPSQSLSENLWSPLHHAAENIQPEIGKLLIHHGCKVDAVDRFGQTALHIAVDAEWDTSSQINSIAIPAASKMLLLAGADPFKPNNKDQSPFDIAKSYRYEKFIHLVNTRDEA